MLLVYQYFKKFWWDYNQYKALGPIQFDKGAKGPRSGLTS